MDTAAFAWVVETFQCERCGLGEMDEQHCKLICPRCGYTRDCTDP